MHSDNHLLSIRLRSGNVLGVKAAAHVLVVLFIGVLGITTRLDGADRAQETKPTISGTEYSSPAIVECVRKLSLEVHLLARLNKNLALVTHSCSGGVYLVDSSGVVQSESPMGTQPIEGMFAVVVQGWWLHSLTSVTLVDDNTVAVVGRFLTGVGPCGTRPFSALITVQKYSEVWRSTEPTLGEASKLKAGANVQCKQ